MTLPRALLLDSTFLIAYERERNPRLAQAVVVQAITTGRPLIATALSVTAAGAHLNGHHPDLSWLLDDPAAPIEVLALAGNALHIGNQLAQTPSRDLTALEVAQIVVEANDGPMVVMTYDPKLYAGTSVNVMDMQPR